MTGQFKRQLAAIVFTDIVGYTHLMHINEEHALLLRSRHRSILLALHEKYGGEVLQFFFFDEGGKWFEIVHAGLMS